jgi:hypothetical protein
MVENLEGKKQCIGLLFPEKGNLEGEIKERDNPTPSMEKNYRAWDNPLEDLFFKDREHRKIKET